MINNSTKRIQPAHGWCATVGGGGLCKLYPPTPPLRRHSHPVCFGKPAVRPRSMAGGAPTPCGLSPIQDQYQHQKPFHTHALNHPHSQSTLAHQSNPLKPSHPTLLCPPQDPHFLSARPHTHSLQSRPNTTYTSRLSPHIPITQTSIRRTQPSSSHPHTRTLTHTKQTKDLQNKTQRDKNSSTQRKRHKEHRGGTQASHAHNTA